MTLRNCFEYAPGTTVKLTVKNRAEGRSTIGIRLRADDCDDLHDHGERRDDLGRRHFVGDDPTRSCRPRSASSSS